MTSHNTETRPGVTPDGRIPTVGINGVTSVVFPKQESFKIVDKRVKIIRVDRSGKILGGGTRNDYK